MLYKTAEMIDPLGVPEGAIDSPAPVVAQDLVRKYVHAGVGYMRYCTAITGVFNLHSFLPTTKCTYMLTMYVVGR